MRFDYRLIHATEDEQLRTIVKKANGFHDGEFQPRVLQLYELGGEWFVANNEHEQAMGALEQSADQLTSIADEFEGKVKVFIDKRVASGSNVADILKTENTWADMAMEIQKTIAGSRIVIEEYAQAHDADSDPIRKKLFCTVRAALDYSR